MTDEADDRIGHLNTILARGGGNLNDPIFKSSNVRALPGGGGMLKFRFDRRIVSEIDCHVRRAVVQTRSLQHPGVKYKGFTRRRSDQMGTTCTASG